MVGTVAGTGEASETESGLGSLFLVGSLTHSSISLRTQGGPVLDTEAGAEEEKSKLGSLKSPDFVVIWATSFKLLKTPFLHL